MVDIDPWPRTPRPKGPSTAARINNFIGKINEKLPPPQWRNYKEPSKPLTKIEKILICAVGIPITIFFYFCTVVAVIGLAMSVALNIQMDRDKKQQQEILDEKPNERLIGSAISDIRTGEEAIRNAAVECIRKERKYIIKHKNYDIVADCTKKEAKALEELKVSVVYIAGVDLIEQSEEFRQATAPLVEGILASTKECSKIAKNETECKRIEQETLAKLDPTENEGCLELKRYMRNRYNGARTADCSEFSELRLGFTQIMKRPLFTFWMKENVPTVVQRNFGQVIVVIRQRIV